MSFKIPCGGFKLDEKSFSLDENGVLFVPKPLTYDYMPEGYPSKDIEYATLMEEQEVAFSENEGLMGAISPVALDIKLGDKLTVVWDGVNYDVVVKERVTSGPGGNRVEKMFGNLALINRGESEDYPFAYYGAPAPVNASDWITADTATSHTIKVMRQQETYTPMDVNYIPKNFNVVFIAETGDIPTSCNVTYDELRGWVENNIPILSIYRRIDSNYAEIITTIQLGSDSLVLGTAGANGFVYNSDGTFSVVEEI